MVNPTITTTKNITMQQPKTASGNSIVETDTPPVTAGTRLLAAVWFLVALSTIIFLGVHFSRTTP